MTPPRTTPPMDRTELREAIEAKAHELGFALVGVARAAESSRGDALRQWIADGKHGEIPKDHIGHWYFQRFSVPLSPYALCSFPTK